MKRYKKRRWIIIAATAGVIFVGLILATSPREFQLITTFSGHTGSVRSLASDRSGNVMASGGADGVRMWDPRTGHQLHRIILPVTTSHPPTVQFLPQQEFIYADRSRGVVVLDTQTWSVSQIFGRPAYAMLATASPDGRWVVGYFEHHDWENHDNLLIGEFNTNGYPHQLLVWDRNAPATVTTLTLERPHNLVCLTFHPVLPHVASIDTNGMVTSWHIDGRVILREVSWNGTRTSNLHRSKRPASACIFSPNGRHLYTPASAIEYPEGVVRLLRHPHRPRRVPSRRAVAVSPDGKVIATAEVDRVDNSGDAVISFWNARDLSWSREFVAATNLKINAMTFLPDGRSLAITGESYRIGWDKTASDDLARIFGPGSDDVTVWRIQNDESDK